MQIDFPKYFCFIIFKHENKSCFGQNTEPLYCPLNSFVGESMKDDSTMVFAYYKEGQSNPTFLYFRDALKEVKC